MRIRVYYEDTDAGGVVYHSRYLNFCERARSELFFEKHPEILEAARGHFLLASVNAKFIKPAKLGDLLEVKNELLELKNASVRLRQELFRQKERLFSADFVLVFVKEGKASAMSKELKSSFAKLFG